jgi:hypothetical protein
MLVAGFRILDKIMNSVNFIKKDSAKQFLLPASSDQHPASASFYELSLLNKNSYLSV